MGAALNIIMCQDEWFNSVPQGSDLFIFCREGKCTSVGEKSSLAMLKSLKGEEVEGTENLRFSWVYGFWDTVAFSERRF